jgi:hypothetical protein
MVNGTTFPEEDGDDTENDITHGRGAEKYLKWGPAMMKINFTCLLGWQNVNPR